jgi:hypothetical protein
MSHATAIPSGPTNATCDVAPDIGATPGCGIMTPGPGPSTPGPGCIIMLAGGRLFLHGARHPAMTALANKIDTTKDLIVSPPP